MKKPVKKKKKYGAPTKYKPEYNKQAYQLCLVGYTDQQLAVFFEVSRSTLNEWRKLYPLFKESIVKGKCIADGNVAEKLYNRATGYNLPEVNIRVIKGKIVETKISKHYPPDTTAAIFWLKNRQKDAWRDRHNIEFENMTDEQLDKVIDELKNQAAKTVNK